jgi:hypothetical protein
VTGEPHPDLAKGIRDEHCVAFGCGEEFESDNYGVKTTPKDEYEITTGVRECPARSMLDRNGNRVRKIQSVGELSRTQAAIRAGLGEEEIVAVVRDSVTLEINSDHLPWPGWPLRRSLKRAQRRVHCKRAYNAARSVPAGALHRPDVPGGFLVTLHTLPRASHLSPRHACAHVRPTRLSPRPTPACQNKHRPHERTIWRC